ncbi:MAG: cell envelope integrity protein TolA, partial [Jannaschia sp.]
APSTPAPSGPPLTQGEQDGLRVAVSACWVVDPGAPSASVVVTLAFDMDRDGNPRTDTIRQLGASGGDGAATQRAFESARRAVIRCANGGYALPVEKYEQWREIEMTFDPTTMRLR